MKRSESKKTLSQSQIKCKMQTTWNWLMEMHTFAKVIVVVLLRVTRETKEVMMQAHRTCVGTETRKTNNKYTWTGDLQTI